MGVLEDLDIRVRRLMTESRDIYFTDYLKALQGRIINQKYQADLLSDELDKNYKVYQQRVQNTVMSQSVAVPRTETIPQTVPSSQTGVFSGSLQGNMVSCPPASAQIQNTEQEQAQTPKQVQVSTVDMACVPASAAAMTASEPKTSAEFKVGAILLSIVGGIFVLSALVMLGMYFMNGMIKGLSLYAVSLLFLILAEGVLYRRWQRLGITISAISIGGLYVSTIVNYLSLIHFSAWVLLGITAAITLFVIFLSRIRDNIGYRFLGMFSCFVCSLIWKGGFYLVDCLAVTGVILALNLACICVPVKKAGTGFYITYMSANTVFSILYLWKAIWYHAPDEAYAAFVVSSLLIMHLIYIAWVKRQEKAAWPGTGPDYVPGLAAYGLCAFVYFWMLNEVGNGLYTELWLRHSVMAGTVFVCVLTFIALWKTELKWAPYYLLSALVFTMYGVAFGEQAIVYCLLGLLITAKILGLWKIPALRVSEAVITAACCLAGVLCYDKIYGIILIAAITLSILCMTTWKTYYEIIITFTLAVFAALSVPNILRLPLFTGVLFAGMLLFNNVKRWQGKGILLYNGLALSGQIICMLLLINPVYRNAYITFLCMLVFGMATIVLTLHDKYHMGFKGKNMVLAVFLSYMAFIFKTNLPVLNSALLMVIALVCVGIGFVAKERAVRIYGLVLSLIVCGKLVLYDFFGAPTLQKTIVFLVVGVIALVIAAIYMVLEKKNNSRNGVE